MTSLASRADITLDLGLLGDVEAIVLYRDGEAAHLTAVYIQINEHLVNVLTRLGPEAEDTILAVIFPEEPEPVSTDVSDLLAELGGAA